MHYPLTVSLTALALATELAVAQTITRTSVTDIVAEDVGTSGPITASQSTEQPHFFIRELFRSNQLGVEPEVSLASVDLMTTFNVVAEWTFRSVTSEPTSIEGYLNTERFSWLNGDVWIFVDQQQQLAPWEGAAPLAPGETRTFSDSYYACHEVSASPGHFAWQDILAGGQYSSMWSTVSGYFLGRSVTGALLPVELVSATATGTMTVKMTEVYELAETPSAVYCSSPPNSTGATGRLMTYGSPAAQSEMFSVQAVGLPIGTAALLFMATDFASVPSGSTTLCISGAIRRAGGVQIATNGTAQFDVDLVGYPSGSPVYLQSFYRDPLLGVGATSGSVVLVQ